MEHGQLVRGLLRQLVHNVKGEVELLLVLKADGFEDAVFVQLSFDKRRGDSLPILAGQLLVDKPLEPVLLRGELLGALHDDGVELALGALGGNHAVGGGGVVVDGIPLVEHLNVVAHLHLHGAFQNDVQLLAHVGGKLDGHLLLGLLIGHGDEEGLGRLVFKQGGHVQVLKALPPGDGQAVALAVDGVAGQGGGHALNQVGGVNAKALGALVDKGEAEVLLPGLALLVLLQGDAGALGHFPFGKAGDFPHGADALRHLCQLCFQIGFFHGCAPFCPTACRFPACFCPALASEHRQNKKPASRKVFP